MPSWNPLRLSFHTICSICAPWRDRSEGVDLQLQGGHIETGRAADWATWINISRTRAPTGCRGLRHCDVSARGVAETEHLCEVAGLPQGLRVTSHVADVSDEAEALRFREEVAAQHATDRIHLLFNNAGIRCASSSAAILYGSVLHAKLTPLAGTCMGHLGVKRFSMRDLLS
jgi:hypothetical protein